MVVAVFRSRLRADAGEDYPVLARRMLELAESMAGFRSFKTFSADDGERVSIIEFESIAQLEAWRDHPEHRQAQAMGRERFYRAYRVQVCESVRDTAFGAADRTLAPPAIS
jgi:heme-degrading monooxygenase HmoA